MIATSESDVIGNADFGFLGHGGEMTQRIREFNWAGTAIGGPEGWSPALRTMLQIMLANRFPHILWWGPEYIQFYNDAYRPIPGTKHPHKVLGRPAHECWEEIWHIIGPLIDRPFRGGPATWNDDILLEVNRHGFFEETHFTIAYSPVPDDTAPGGIGGVLATVHEITEKVIAERRVVALRDLGARVADARTAEEACAVAAKILGGYAKDVPFALLYLLEPTKELARLAGAAGVEAGGDINPPLVDLRSSEGFGWQFAEARRTGVIQSVGNLSTRFAKVPSGPWSDPPNSAVVLPVPSSKPHELAGFLVAGISARLQHDPFYWDFFELARTQIATAINNARAYEEERKRAEALAEIDRAKTKFFNNVSHEFRTPLTLMLGPIEDLLQSTGSSLQTEVREQLQLVHRNGLRLLRLVNSLLDFSRIEAGRLQASYQPTDAAMFTAELASVFRAATERAGLRLLVDCPSCAEPVYLDRQMWEKIVLNLISNAFKFTFEGEIEVSARTCPEKKSFELRVRDTGAGIPPEEMPRLFERFHRVEACRSRTHEGTGIGLALVQELVKLHGGTIVAESEPNKGSTFVVTIPMGTAHLPADRIREACKTVVKVSGAAPFVEEALRWLPNDPDFESLSALPALEQRVIASGDGEQGCANSRASILIADDNSDMRHYVQRLLAAHYQVEAVPDGRAAVAAAKRQLPDLILSDVMMPELDGFGLVREIRADAALRDIPILLLSARAAEESRVEGLEKGADDYIVKPFTARELIARIESHLQLARLRRETRDQLRQHAARLEKTVAARTEALRATVHELETFSYSIAHDMRAPLRAMHGFAKILEEEHAQNLNGEGRNYLRRVYASAERLDALIRDVLSYSRIARTELKLETVDAEALLKEILESYPEFQAPHVQILLAEPLPKVFANRAALTQVFSNLLGNAVKFVRKGAKPVVKVRAEFTDGNGVRFWFEDNGIGIRPEVRERVFQMFTRLNPASEYEGTGIGLTIVKKAVERMGGTVGVESEAGAGSRFWVELQRGG